MTEPNKNATSLVDVMADITGLPREEVASIADQVKANQAKLKGCKWHDFELMDSAPKYRTEYKCKHCLGTIDVSAYRWHEVGRKSALGARE